MAYLSIAQRAKRMFKPGTGELRGDTLHIIYHEPQNGPHTGRFDNVCARLGTRPVAYAYSYNTLVATLVANENTGQHEFWLTDVRYSATTDRHCRHLLSAWHEFAPSEIADANLYRFDMATFVHRCDPSQLHRAVRRVWTASFPLIVSKGRHEATRRAFLHEALRNVEGALRLVTKDVPMDALTASCLPLDTEDAVQTCTAMRDMLQGFTALSVPQLRATVSGLLALEHDDSTARG